MSPIGWQCASCGWATIDLDVMQSAVWPEGADGRVVSLVCPQCHDEGNFIDYHPRSQ